MLYKGFAPLGCCAEHAHTEMMPMGRSCGVFFCCSLFTTELEVVNYSDTTNSESCFHQPGGYSVPADAISRLTTGTALDLSAALTFMILS